MKKKTKEKKESKKFIKFKSCCEFHLCGDCFALHGRSDCFEKKCRLLNSKYKTIYFGKTRQFFDSDEELEFYCYLMEGEEHGLFSDIKCKPPSFDLSQRATIKFDKHTKTKIKTVDKFILHPHIYTPDFFFKIKSDKISKLNFFIENPGKEKFMIVDVKGGFSKSVDRFSINQKWVMHKYGYYVQKIVPEKLFCKSFVPEIAKLTPKRKEQVKKYVEVKTIKDFMEGK